MDSLLSTLAKDSDSSPKDVLNAAQTDSTAATEPSSAPGDAGPETGDNSGSNGNSDDGDLSSKATIEFDEDALIKNRVFAPTGLSAIAYTVEKDDVELDMVQLMANNSRTFQSIANATYNSKGFSFKDPFADVNMTHAVLQGDSATLRRFYGNEMKIEITWHSEDVGTGKSWSTYFTVDEVTGAEAEVKREELLQESTEDNENGYETIIASPTSTGAANTSGMEGGLSSETKVADSSSDDGGSGGMSTGAKAGAAVGGVIGGLLIIGAIVWFLLRRRRQRKIGSDHSGEQPYVVDKETQGRGTDSPSYGDGGHTNKPVAFESVDHDREEGAVPRISLGDRSRGGTSGVQTPQGISSNVAHLVEDGMTADEIRRLEEEERQLDDEIERAARR